MDDQRPLYDRDFHAWTVAQAAALREAGLRSNLPIDFENVAEEIESLGRSDRQQIRSRLEVLLLRLLKLDSIAETESRRGWPSTVTEQRIRILDLVNDSPSLAGYPAQVLEQSYANAVLQARTAGLTSLPATCPWPIAAVLDHAWFPERMA